MAKMVLTAAYLNLSSNDLSAYCKKIELAIKIDDKETTSYASAGWKEFLGGLKAGTLNIEFYQDVANGNLDSIMWPLLGTIVTFEVRLANTTVTTSNPKWTGSVLIDEWKPITGSVGDVAMVTVGYPTSGAVTRATS